LKLSLNNQLNIALNCFLLIFLAFDFCRFCVVYPRFYPLHLFSYLNSWDWW